MRILIILCLFLSTICYGQLGNYCFDDSYMEYVQKDSITYIYFMDVDEDCPDSSWHTAVVFCHNGSYLEKFSFPIGDTLKLLLGKEQVHIATAIRRKKGTQTYGTSYPNICLSDVNDVDCFEQYQEPVVEPPIIGSFTIENNCIIPSLSAVIIFWDALYPFDIKVADMKSEQPFCLFIGQCFYLVYQDGTVSSTHCL